MSKYDSFEIFMIDVVNKANSISNLNELFDVKYEELVSKLTTIIRNAGWLAFTGLCVLLTAGPIVFGIGVGTFLLTPVGIAIAAVLGITAATIIRQIYKNKELPLAIKRVGSKYEKRWKEANGNAYIIDGLFKNAVFDLLHSGKRSLSGDALSLLSKFTEHEW
ncbi:MAG: hypothetical protein IJ606_04720 [Bacteroidaceae bacterium]|nr:hypothetical protein [Bacteroidaceae bacterium]